jgi:cysteinyl-tRNA synthetase
VSDLYELARAVDGAIEAGVEEDLVSRARASLGRLLVSGSGQLAPSSTDLVGGIAPFVEILIDVRSRLRAANEWALADELRGRLAALGITLEDGPAGTTWKSSNSH